MQYLNVGCGTRFHSQWTNVDLFEHPPYVTACDITQGLPFGPHAFDVVYHSHLLEHLAHTDGRSLLAECYRVLAPGGCIRIVVPDLERIARAYLETLEKALKGDSAAAQENEWMHLEMYDQMTRDQTGGEMVEYFRRSPLPAEEFALSWAGEAGKATVDYFRKDQDGLTKDSEGTILDSLVSMKQTMPNTTKYKLIRRFLGEKSALAWQIGMFRMGGEPHKSMYDRFSLAKALNEVGFRRPELMTAGTSGIPNWTTYLLDTLEDGTVVKPDSLFMEAIKPAAN